MKMTVRKWLVAAAAAAVAIAFVGCGNGAGGNDNGGETGNGGDDVNGVMGTVFNLRTDYYFQGLPVGATGEEVTPATVPLMRAGGGDDISVGIAVDGDVQVLTWTPVQTWAGIDLVNAHSTSRVMGFRAGDTVSIGLRNTGEAASSIRLDAGGYHDGTSPQNLFPAVLVAAGGSHTFEFTLTAAQIGHIAGASPSSIRIVSGAANNPVMLTELLVRGTRPADFPGFVPDQADLSYLNAAITAANTALAGAVSSPDGAGVLETAYWVPTAIHAALTAAITAAQAVRDAAASTQAQVDEAVTALNAAVLAFTTAMKPGLQAQDPLFDIDDIDGLQNSGGPVLRKQGEYLVITERTNGWYAIDTEFDALEGDYEIDDDALYAVIVTGRLLGSGTAVMQFPLVAAPYGVLITNQIVAANENFRLQAIVPGAHINGYQRVIPDIHQTVHAHGNIRVTAGANVDIVITAFVLQRLADGGNIDDAPLVFVPLNGDLPSDFDMPAPECDETGDWICECGPTVDHTAFWANVIDLLDLTGHPNTVVLTATAGGIRVSGRTGWDHGVVFNTVVINTLMGSPGATGNYGHITNIHLDGDIGAGGQFQSAGLDDATGFGNREAVPYLNANNHGTTVLGVGSNANFYITDIEIATTGGWAGHTATSVFYLTEFN